MMVRDNPGQSGIIRGIAGDNAASESESLSPISIHIVYWYQGAVILCVGEPLSVWDTCSPSDTH
jgi:hypothetical protein